MNFHNNDLNLQAYYIYHLPEHRTNHGRNMALMILMLVRQNLMVASERAGKTNGT